MRTRIIALMAIAIMTALTIGETPVESHGAGNRLVHMTALEYKGTTNISSEAYPPADESGTLALDPLGSGYQLKAPDGSGNWQVSTYRFEPGALTVSLLDQVTLEIVGVNGKRHDSRLVSPSGVEKSFVVTRGRMTRVTFQANEPGLWKLACSTHVPSMTADIAVLPV